MNKQFNNINELNKNKIERNPLDILVEKKRLPAYFIGSGFSRRYLKNYPDWNQLLYKIARKIGLTEIQYNSLYKSTYDLYKNRGECNQQVATYLQNLLNKNLVENANYANKLFPNKDDYNFIKANPKIDIFKYLLCLEFTQKEYKNAKFKQKEIKILREMLLKSCIIITTNYDDFIENDLLDNQYQTFVDQQSYYMPEVVGIGEIYKIHGSFTDPNSIIITKNDYENFNDTLKLTIAKIMTILCEYPIIFIGYSLNDDNIKNIMHSLISCLSEEQLQIFKENIILINWEENQTEIKYSDYTFEYKGKTLTITNITTDNYQRVYSILNKFTPSMPPTAIRKCNKLVKELVYKSNTGEKDCFVIDVNDIDKLNSNNTIISFTSSLAYASLSDIEILEDALFNTNKINPNQLLTVWVDNNKAFASTQWKPLYYFLNKVNNIEQYKQSEKLNKFIECKNKSFENMKKEPYIKHTNSDIEDFIKSCKTRTTMLKTLMLNRIHGNIDKDIYINILRNLYRNEYKYFTSNEISSFNKCVTMIDYFEIKS